jgi:hypothetical protein
MLVEVGDLVEVASYCSREENILIDWLPIGHV